MKKTIVLIAILFFWVAILITIPSSTQTVPPDGDFGDDDFDHALQSYDFWTGATNTVYFVSGSGQLILNGGGDQVRLIHSLIGFFQDSIIRIRFRITVDTPTFVHFSVCGNSRGISVGKRDIIGNTVFSPPVTCESWSFTGIGGDNTPNDFDTTIRYTRSQDVFLIFWSDVTTYAYVDYFSVQCSWSCTKAPLATATPIIKPTGLPRTVTPTAYVPIQLTPPPDLDGQGGGDANCGVYQCGSVNLSFPVLPPLDSPTPLSIVGIGEPTLIGLVTPITGDFVPSTPVFNDNGGGDDLGDYIGGGGVLAPNDPNTGAPITADFDSILPPDNSLFIAYIKGIYDTNANYFGPFAPLVQVVLSVGTLLMFIISGRLILPVAIILIGLIRKAWSAIMDLIPF